MDSISAGKKTLTRLPAQIARAAIRVYQLTLSPFIGNQCRFHPSCSNYALEAIERHGAVKGGWLALKRLGRCHPFNEGGFDPVPDSDRASGTESPGTMVNHSTNEASDGYPAAKEI